MEQPAVIVAERKSARKGSLYSQLSELLPGALQLPRLERMVEIDADELVFPNTSIELTVS